jgi:AraC-like DNA-binding protein
MDTIFSTATVHPRDRFDCWHEVACKRIVGHHSRALSRPAFEANLQAGSLADIELLIFQNSPMNVARTRSDIAQARSDDLFVCRQLSGTVTLDQEGREIALSAGDFCLLDPLLPYTGRFIDNSKMLVLKVARRRLEAPAGKTYGMTARPLGRGAAGELTSGFLGLLPAYASGPQPGAVQIEQQTLDLVGHSISVAMAKECTNNSSPRALVSLRLRAAVEKRLSDPLLSPATAAEAAGISVRYANLILAEQQTSLARFIQSLRLERCRRAMTDPSQAHRTLSDIAFGWGFSDVTHFSRSFKKSFGVPPRDYRAQARQRNV